MGRIKVKTYVMPSSHDTFFPVEHCAAEQKMIPNSELRVINSLWAHFAMFCLTPNEKEQIDKNLRDLLHERV